MSHDQVGGAAWVRAHGGYSLALPRKCLVIVAGWTFGCPSERCQPLQRSSGIALHAGRDNRALPLTHGLRIQLWQLKFTSTLG